MTEGSKLIDTAELDERQVTTVASRHGKLAVGVSGGSSFAVSNRCRHLGASLGEGKVAENGCLQCPWHGAQYDVTNGKMTLGPQGAVFAPVRPILKAVARLKHYATTLHDGHIDLAE